MLTGTCTLAERASQWTMFPKILCMIIQDFANAPHVPESAPRPSVVPAHPHASCCSSWELFPTAPWPVSGCTARSAELGAGRPPDIVYYPRCCSPLPPHVLTPLLCVTISIIMLCQIPTSVCRLESEINCFTLIPAPGCYVHGMWVPPALCI